MKNPFVNLHSINDKLCESWTKSFRGETNLLDAIMTFVIPCLGLVTSAEFSNRSIPVQIIIALVVTILSATGYYYASRHLMGKKNCNRHRPRNVIRASEAATLLNEIVPSRISPTCSY